MGEWAETRDRTNLPETLIPHDEEDTNPYRVEARTPELLGLTIFSFPYGLICSILGLFVLPIEARRLYPGAPSVALGVFLGVSGVSQLVCPFAGMVSDRQEAASPLFKRQPYIVLGTVVGSLGLGGMALASYFTLGVVYAFFLFVSLSALNMIYSVQGGLVPDLTVPACHSKASGLVAVGTVFGSSFGMFIMIVSASIQVQLLYLFSSLLVLATCTLVLGTGWSLDKKYQEARSIVAEEPRQGYCSQLGHWSPPQVTFTDMRRCFIINTENGMDFVWVFWGRTFYYIGVSCQAFFLYFLRDYVGIEDGSYRKRLLGILAIIAQTVAACCAVPFGKLSEHERVGKKKLIYFACCSMAVVYFGFIVSGVVEIPLIVLIVSSVVYGIGNGCFLSVDYALALETLPSSDDVTQSLGLWGVSGFIGSSVGPLIWGALIEVVGGTEQSGVYNRTGYILMLSGGVVATMMAGLIIAKVKSAK